MNSSKYVATPILIQVLEHPGEIFCAAIYCTNDFKAPHLSPIDEFLSDFLNDIKLLQELMYDTGLKVLLGLFVCDAPMRATLKTLWVTQDTPVVKDAVNEVNTTTELLFFLLSIVN